MIGRCHVFGTDVRSQERIDAEQCQNCQSPISFLFTVTKPGRGIASCPQKHMLEMERRRRNECETWCSWRDSPVLQQWQFFITTGWHFHIKNRTNSSTKGFFSEKKYLFWFIADWPCWELSEALQHIMAHHATPPPPSPCCPFHPQNTAF